MVISGNFPAGYRDTGYEENGQIRKSAWKKRSSVAGAGLHRDLVEEQHISSYLVLSWATK